MSSKREPPADQDERDKLTERILRVLREHGRLRRQRIIEILGLPILDYAAYTAASQAAQHEAITVSKRLDRVLQALRRAGTIRAGRNNEWMLTKT